MKTTLSSTILAAIAALFIGSAVQASPVIVALSTVGNPGNAADPANSASFPGIGSVGYTFNIGTYDVTQGQYTVFLNAVAQTDTYSLYNPNMATAGNYSYVNNGFGIVRSGSSGSYSYSVNPAYGNLPVTYVSWFDAARFCNWLSNGQPVTHVENATTTETGAYTLSGTMSGVSVSKNTFATWWIPSENEWYKAAYYDPTLNSGLGGYWKYATKSNTTPGNVVGSASKQANYNNGVYSVTRSASYSNSQNYLTPVGSFTNSASAYGTFDQAGNVWNWIDAVRDGLYRGVRGGSWDFDSSALASWAGFQSSPTDETYNDGFRVATSVLLTPWLLANGFASNTDLQTTSTANGVPLLLAYALQLDPNKNQRSRLPKPVVSGSTLSLTYYGRNADVTYSAQVSSDLKAWTTTGVTVSAPDANGLSTATALTSSSNRLYIRLQVTH